MAFQELSAGVQAGNPDPQKSRGGDETSRPDLKPGCSDHARRRGRERLGLRGGAMDKTTVKAWETGLQHRDTAGALKRYIDGLYMSHPGRVARIHADHVYIFADHKPPLTPTLITVLHLPHEHRRAALDALKKRRR